MQGKNKFRNSTFKELIDRNIGNPAKLKKNQEENSNGICYPCFGTWL